jgi:hypothetical protein
VYYYRRWKALTWCGVVACWCGWLVADLGFQTVDCGDGWWIVMDDGDGDRHRRSRILNFQCWVFSNFELLLRIQRFVYSNIKHLLF